MNSQVTFGRVLPLAVDKAKIRVEQTNMQGFLSFVADGTRADVTTAQLDS